MNNEIKEILDYLSDDSKSFIICGASYYKISDYKAKVLLDYITNLQQIEKDHQKLNGELRKEIKTLQEELQQEKKDFKEANDYCFKLISCKSRIDKAIEYINKVKILNEEYKEDWTFKVFVHSLENILSGGDEE